MHIQCIMSRIRIPYYSYFLIVPTLEAKWIEARIAGTGSFCSTFLKKLHKVVIYFGKSIEETTLTFQAFLHPHRLPIPRGIGKISKWLNNDVEFTSKRQCCFIKYCLLNAIQDSSSVPFSATLKSALKYSRIMKMAEGILGDLNLTVFNLEIPILVFKHHFL